MRRLLPWLLPLLVAVLGLASVDVGPGPIVKYAVYFALAIALPGTLLLRAAWRSTGNWAEDVGLGSVVGATWQLIGWALFTALGWQRWLIVWPALVLAAFAVFGRRFWRIADPKPLPVAWTWGLAVSSAVVLGASTVGVMAYHPMPPDGTAYYPDLLYHLSMVHELMRSVPPELPQVAGERLEYHWFANADMAGAVDITRLAPIVVVFRLWLLPWLVVALLVCATLARTVSRTWWTGVLAARRSGRAAVVLARRHECESGRAGQLPQSVADVRDGRRCDGGGVPDRVAVPQRRGLVVGGRGRRRDRRRWVEAHGAAAAGRGGRAGRGVLAGDDPARACADPRRWDRAGGGGCGDHADGCREHQWFRGCSSSPC